MESGKRYILSGKEFEQFIDEPTGINESIKRNSTLKDTVQFLPEAIKKTYLQASRMANQLQGETIYETCKEIWNWAYKHIQYHKDEPNKEQIRSFRRSFYDRVRGVDCDDFTVLISSLLTCLNIKHILRVAKYNVENGFQHIYPVVPIGNGNYITVDCVVDKFNYEVPFINKIDTPMNLEFLDGIEGNDDANTKLNGIDAEDLMNGYEEIGDLGKGKFKDSKLAQGLKKGIHVANLLNPGAGLLRVGILASMKVNLFKIAERLRYAYLDPSEASNRNLDMSKFNKLVEIKDKLEKIFYGAGGKIENFKKAILTGKGNKNKEVPLSGLGQIDYNDYSEQNSLSQILGYDSYTSEMSEISGLGSLGEPATGAAIAAATSVLAAIAGLLKSIGSLKKGGKDGDPSSEGTTENSASDTSQTPSSNDATTETQTNTTTSNSSINTNPNGGANKSVTDTPANSDTPITTENEVNTSNRITKASNTVVKKIGMMDKVKKWVGDNKVATGLIAVSILGLTTWAVVSLTKKKPTSKSKDGLSGTPNTKKTSKHKKKHHYNKQISYKKLK